VRAPPKAIRERLESSELGFECYLADRLKVTLGELRRMPSEEFETWRVYHAIRAQQMELARESAGG
jgi:hypothetical protein